MSFDPEKDYRSGIEYAIKKVMWDADCTQTLALQERRNMDQYEYVLWRQSLAENFAKLAKFCQEEADVALARIRMDNITSENYELTPAFADKFSTKIDHKSLEFDYPTTYDLARSIKASEAEKVIGTEELRQLVIDKIGEEQFRLISDVTLGRLKQVFTTKILEKYTTKDKEQIGYIVTRKQAELTEGSTDGSN